MIEETLPTQVEEQEQNQPVAKEEGEHMKDRELNQQIEHFIEVTDMDMEQEPHNKDVVLMLSAPYITTQSPPPITVEPTLRRKMDVVPLDNDPMMDVYNLSFNEF